MTEIMSSLTKLVLKESIPLFILELLSVLLNHVYFSQLVLQNLYDSFLCVNLISST